jgi:glucose/arabinose dehydrogenase
MWPFSCSREGQRIVSSRIEWGELTRVFGGFMQKFGSNFRAHFWPLRGSGARGRSLFIFLFVFASLVSPLSRHAMAQQLPDAPAVHLESVVSGLSAPLDCQTARDGTGRLFIVQQGGTIRIVKAKKLLPTPFLNVASLIESGGEKGLLGLAFHPSYKSNGRFFINYTRRVSGQLQTVIAEYHVSSSDPNVADPNSGRIVLNFNQPFDNHNGGQMAFGPDGYLYIGTGDGGSGGDPQGNGQKLSTLLAKMLRIDINSGSPYAVPPDNPFVGVSGAKGEIWAYGLRNPWRFSFDRQNGKRLFVGDVGQDAWEEVDIVTKGGNFGWNIMEGNHCYPAGSNCNPSGLIPPIAEYSHSEGEAVIGGYVYRGAAIPALKGLYVFGDYVSGQMWTLQETQPGVWQRSALLTTGLNISALGRSANNELYVVDYSGTLYKLVAN